MSLFVLASSSLTLNAQTPQEIQRLNYAYPKFASMVSELLAGTDIYIEYAANQLEANNHSLSDIKSTRNEITSLVGKVDFLMVHGNQGLMATEYLDLIWHTLPLLSTFSEEVKNFKETIRLQLIDLSTLEDSFSRLKEFSSELSQEQLSSENKAELIHSIEKINTVEQTLSDIKFLQLDNQKEADLTIEILNQLYQNIDLLFKFQSKEEL